MKTFLLTLALLTKGLLSAQDAPKFFGEKFTVNKDTENYNMMAELSKNDEVNNVQITGVVEEVCQKKGCWLRLKTADGKVIQVVFKDYAFFVPKDLAGKKVVLQGKGWLNFTAVEELRHYAQDAGKSKDEIAAITEPKREPRFEATGVAVY